MSFLTLRGRYKIINAELSSQAEGLLTKCNYSCSFKNVNSNLDDFEIKDIFLEDKFSFFTIGIMDLSGVWTFLFFRFHCYSH